MLPSKPCLRRFLFGLSVDESQVNFDTPEGRRKLRVTHERQNLGVYHELQVAQRKRDRLSPERRFHITRFTKPSVKGFQCYIKEDATDYVVQELWTEDEQAVKSITEAGDGEEDGEQDKIDAAEDEDDKEANTAESDEANDMDDENGGGRNVAAATADGEVAQMDAAALAAQLNGGGDAFGAQEVDSEGVDSAADSNSFRHVLHLSAKDPLAVADAAHEKFETAMLSQPPRLVNECLENSVSMERDECRNCRNLVMERLKNASEKMQELVYETLQESRDSRALLDQRKSVVERLIEEANDAKQKGYRPLSSSSHLLEPQELATMIAQRKDKDVLAAIKSPLLSFAAPDVSVSLSLWVAGSVLIDDKIGSEFPFHLVKHATSLMTTAAAAENEGGANNSAASASRLPRAHVEVYFSPEMYQLASVIGKEGVLTLRSFIGRAMRRQHSPQPHSASLLMNASRFLPDTSRSSSNSVAVVASSVSGSSEDSSSSSVLRMSVQIPWVHEWSAKVGRNTETVRHNTVAQEKSVPPQKMQEAIHLVWRVWGNLVKDLHITGDLDFLYIRVDETLALLASRKDMEQLRLLAPPESLTTSPLTLAAAPSSTPTLAWDTAAATKAAPPTPPARIAPVQQLEKVKGRRQSDGTLMAMTGKQREVLRQSVVVPADFVVVECLLEKRGVSHRFIIEDLTETLTAMQQESMEVARLAALDAAHAEHTRQLAAAQEQHLSRARANEADDDAAEDDDEGSDGDGNEKGQAAKKKKPRKNVKAPKKNTKQASLQAAEKAAAALAESWPELIPTPIIYAPQIIISHAGVIEKGTHSYQRIRIRGSCLSHIEAVMEQLANGEHFTEREITAIAAPAPQGKRDAPLAGKEGQVLLPVPQTALPANLSFRAGHASEQVVGGGGPAVQGGRNSGRHGTWRSAMVSSSSQRLSRWRQYRTTGQFAVDKEEREFWSTHNYRLHEPTIIFHDRVDSEVATIKRSEIDVDSLSPRLRTLLLQRGGGVTSDADIESGDGNDAAENDDDELEESDSGVSHKGSGKRGSGGGGGAKTPAKTKRGGKRGSSAKKRGVLTVESVVASLSAEKLFECICVDMELDSAAYDLRVGDNAGYHFHVKLKHVPDADFGCVKPAMKSVVEKGFVNYYGPQRFGTYAAHNMHPGLHLLKGEFRAAATIIVQQFYLDAAAASQRNVAGASGTFGGVVGSHGTRMAGYSERGMYNIPDFVKRFGKGSRSVEEHGTALQVVLNNTLQAAAYAVGEAEEAYREDEDELGAHSGVRETGHASAVAEDICRDAFLNVVGLPVCRMLVNEYLSFVWNDIVNQRLQRYGTFAILPGDLVLPWEDLSQSTSVFMCGSTQTLHSGAVPRADHARDAPIKKVTRREIEAGKFNVWDVVLPVPGFNITLPDNHTTDLYVVTMKRYGLPFNPETRQWDALCGGVPSLDLARMRGIHAKSSGGAPSKKAGSAEKAADATRREKPSIMSPRPQNGLKSLSTLSLLLQEEQAAGAPFLESVMDDEAGDSQEGGGLDFLTMSSPTASGGQRSVGSAAGADGAEDDLVRGNALGTTFFGGYRHPLINPSATLRWRMNVTRDADPHHRWFLSMKETLKPGDRYSGDQGWRGKSATKMLPPVDKSAYKSQKFMTLPPNLVGDAALAQVKEQKAVIGSSRYMPYWLPKKSDGVVDLRFNFPSSVYPGMMLREISKNDVNASDVVNIYGGASDQSIASRVQAKHAGAEGSKQRKVFKERPRALSVALLHQQIFRSGGMRYSLLPSTRGFDNVI